jgi:hypothetical protein
MYCLLEVASEPSLDPVELIAYNPQSAPKKDEGEKTFEGGQRDGCPSLALTRADRKGTAGVHKLPSSESRLSNVPS